MRCDAWAGTLLWWNCQSPVAHRYGLPNHPNSFHGGLFKLNAKLDVDPSLYSLSHFECDGHTVHVLTQWCLPPPLTSTGQSSLFTVHIPVRSPWLPGYTEVTWTPCYMNTGWTFSGQTSYTLKSTEMQGEVAVCLKDRFLEIHWHGWLLVEFLPAQVQSEMSR